jgi:hypothetical protein
MAAVHRHSDAATNELSALAAYASKQYQERHDHLSTALTTQSEKWQTEASCIAQELANAQAEVQKGTSAVAAACEVHREALTIAAANTRAVSHLGQGERQREMVCINVCVIEESIVLIPPSRCAHSCYFSLINSLSIFKLILSLCNNRCLKETECMLPTLEKPLPKNKTSLRLCGVMLPLSQLLTYLLL